MTTLSAQFEADLQRQTDFACSIHRRAYRDGYLAALRMYAHWVDGEQFVGTGGKTLAKAIAEFDETYSSGAEPRRGSPASRTP